MHSAAVMEQMSHGVACLWRMGCSVLLALVDVGVGIYHGAGSSKHRRRGEVVFPALRTAAAAMVERAGLEAEDQNSSPNTVTPQRCGCR